MRLRGAGFAVGVVVAAWAVGSTALAVLGLGLCLAVALARGWAWLVARSLSVERRPPSSTPVEGEALALEAQIRGRRLLASRLEWRERIGPLGERSAVVGRGGRARVVVDAVPRGRYPLGPGRLVAGDPLGLRTVELEVPSQTTLLVRPRVVELTTLFTETGAWNDGGRRAQVRRPSGLEPHGVREYVEGEPFGPSTGRPPPGAASSWCASWRTRRGQRRRRARRRRRDARGRSGRVEPRRGGARRGRHPCARRLAARRSS